MDTSLFGINLPAHYRIPQSPVPIDQELREVFGEQSYDIGMAYTECLYSVSK